MEDEKKKQKKENENEKPTTWRDIFAVGHAQCRPYQQMKANRKQIGVELTASKPEWS